MKLFNKVFPFIVLSLIMVIIIPVPTVVLDFLLSLNITLSCVVFLMSMYTKNILEFTILPTVLLYITLFRIILNVTSAKLILGQANGGKLIEAIGTYSVGGNYVVGIISYIIIAIVMFIVITKGSERIAEVSARFALDAMPGKQMSIDADLNSGAISLAVAKKRREDLQKEADFYKSMDGANKFVRGDAITSILITLVNIIGGLIMGVAVHNMALSEAASKYTILSIGDGLVNQVPALLIAVATSSVITKENSNEDLSSNMAFQFLRYKQPLRITSIILLILAICGIIGIMPGLPWFILAVMSAISFAFSNLAGSLKHENEDETLTVSAPAIEEPQEQTDNFLYVDKIVLKIGSNIIEYMAVDDTENGGKMVSPDLKLKIDILKNKIKSKYGVKLQEIRIVDDNYIQSNSFVVKIPNTASMPITVRPNCLFAVFINPNTVIDYGELSAIEELDLKGYWISKENEQNAESMGGIIYTLYDMIVLHLENCIENNLDKLITREDIKEYKQEITRYNSAICDELNNKQIENSLIQKVTESLLIEKVPIKNFQFILECISDYVTEAGRKATPDMITQYIRMKMSNTLTENFVQDGSLKVVVLSEESHQTIIKRLKGEISDDINKDCNKIYATMAVTHKQLTELGEKFVFVCNKAIRAELFRCVSDLNVKINIISYEELPKFVKYVQLKEI